MASPEPTPLAYFSLTHVHYNPNDPISYISAFLALAPQALCVIYVTLIWATREIEVFLMFVGQMACETLNFGLKRWIREERPKYMHGKGYGMPSSHAQFVAYFSVYLSLFLLIRHSPTTATSQHSFTFLQRVGISILACLGASAVSASRLYLNYHTQKQVLFGCAFGALFALFWFSVTSALRNHGWIQWGLDQRISRALRVRDLVVREDFSEAGWQRWEHLQKLNQREDKDNLRKVQ